MRAISRPGDQIPLVVMIRGNSGMECKCPVVCFLNNTTFVPPFRTFLALNHWRRSINYFVRRLPRFIVNVTYLMRGSGGGCFAAEQSVAVKVVRLLRVIVAAIFELKARHCCDAAGRIRQDERRKLVHCSFCTWCYMRGSLTNAYFPTSQYDAMISKSVDQRRLEYAASVIRVDAAAKYTSTWNHACTPYYHQPNLPEYPKLLHHWERQRHVTISMNKLIITVHFDLCFLVTKSLTIYCISRIAWYTILPCITLRLFRSSMQH